MGFIAILSTFGYASVVGNSITHSLHASQNDNSFFNLVEPMVPSEHTDSIYAVAFSADGRLAFSLAKDQTMKVWEVATGREVKRYRMNADHVKTLVVSPNGYWVASGGDGQSIKLWDVATGGKKQLFAGHQRQINTLAFSPDGKYLISAGNDRLIKLWEIKTAKQIRKFRAHKRAIRAVVYSNDGQWIASAGDDKQIILWDYKKSKPKKKLLGHNSPVLALRFSPDGKYLASAGEDKQIIIWNLEQLKPVKYIRGHSKKINDVDYSPDGRYIISASDDKTMRLWDVETGQLLTLFDKHENSVLTSRFSPNGLFVLSGSSDNTIKLWGKNHGNQIRQFKGLATTVNSVTFSPDGNYVFSAHKDRTLKLWDMSNGQNIRVFSRHKGSVNSIQFSPNGKMAVSGSSDNTIKIWRVNNAKELKTFKGHKATINQVEFVPNGKQILSASADNTIVLWDLKKRRKTQKFIGHKRSVNAISVSPDGKQFLSASKDKTLRLWDIETGESSIVNQLSSPIKTIKYADDGTFAITAGREIVKWAMPSGKMLQKLSYQGAEVNEISISQSGHFMVSASWDNHIKLWNLKSGTLINEFVAHIGGIKSVDFSPDEKRIISAGTDGSMKLWDIQSGEEIIRMVGAKNNEWITLTPDGYYNNSPEGGQLIHWVSKDSTESYSFEQFEKYFKKPGIIRARLAGKKEYGIPVPMTGSPPRVDLVEHLQFFQTSQDTIPVTLNLIDVNTISNIRFFVNGRLALNKQLSEKNRNLKVSIPINSGANQITTIAYNEKGLSSDPRSVSVYSSISKNKSNLHILSIGVSEYKNLDKSLQLSYAHTDAQNFVKRVKHSAETLFKDVHYTYLTNETADQISILKHLEKLSQVKKDDLVMIFFAGHGLRLGGSDAFYLVTYDAEENKIEDKGINWDLITKYINKINSRIIIFLDACHSGSISNKTVVPNNELAEKLFSDERGGVMVFSAAKGRQYAYEAKKLGRGEGIFSYAIARVLGKYGRTSDVNGNGFIEFSELVEDVQHFVDEYTDGNQTPWLSHKELFGDIPIAKVFSDEE